MSENIIGKRIKERREKLGLSAIDVALLTNMARGSIYRYETDRAENITVKALLPLATVLKTTPDYLMGWTDYPEIPDRNISYEKVITCIKECGWTVYDVEKDPNGKFYQMAIEYYNSDKESYAEHIAFKQKNGEDIIYAIEDKASSFDAEKYALNSCRHREKYGQSISIRKLLENGDEFKYLLEKLAYRLRKLNQPITSIRWYKENRKDFCDFFNACICYRSVDSYISQPTQELYNSVMEYALTVYGYTRNDMELYTISDYLAKSLSAGKFTAEEMICKDQEEMLEEIKKENTKENNNGYN